MKTLLLAILALSTVAMHAQLEKQGNTISQVQFIQELRDIDAEEPFGAYVYGSISAVMNSDSKACTGEASVRTVANSVADYWQADLDKLSPGPGSTFMIEQLNHSLIWVIEIKYPCHK
jgi:hypothetical protein